MVPDFAANWAFFLDVDGTLLGFVESPSAVEVEPPLIRLLDELHTLTGGAIALISGRPIRSIDKIFSPLELPVAGQHGFERRRASGELTSGDLDAGPLDEVRDVLRRFAEEHPGAFVEDKEVALALHFRRNPSLGPQVERLVSLLTPRLGPAFHVQFGKMVVEIRPLGRDKGMAIAEFMAEPPFEGKIPVFLGDDATDEDGFRRVKEMRGVPIKVGPGHTVASWRLDNVDAAIEWLSDYVRWFREGGMLL